MNTKSLDAQTLRVDRKQTPGIGEPLFQAPMKKKWGDGK